MKVKALLFFIAAAVLLSACGEENTDYIWPDDNDDNSSTIIKKGMTSPEFFFGFVGQDRYSYCPSIITTSSGTTHVWFCGNPIAGTMVDNIYHVSETNGAVTNANSVLQPSEGTWDSHHTCDPSVVEGEFNMDGTTYKYAMFYLGCKLEYYYNEIGVAFSNDLNTTSWVKYPQQLIHKTWSTDGDQDLGDGNKSWGVGQPAAISLNKKGKVMLVYTRGDAGGTSTVWRECDLSNMDNPIIGEVHNITAIGLTKTDNSTADYITNIDVALDQDSSHIIMIRPVHSNPQLTTYPTYIEEAVEIDYMKYSDFKANRGTWTKLYRIDKQQTGFARNHNPGLQRDSYGYIADYLHPVFYYTVSKEAPDVKAEADMHAEWTFHIYRSQIVDSNK